MKAVFNYVLTGTRGGPNRVRILRAIEAQPRDVDGLSESLDLDHTTVRHHLDVLTENRIVERSDNDDAIYLLADGTNRYWDVFGNNDGHIY
ncbi:ArsR family transcriptional regulator [Halalkalicoccus salilacus]|uniref:ArsR family transcriptional regulator n=1 Tax=Halalkalicoccus salilacus TaxID=3117459 RepID=UPI00300F236D